MNQIEVNTVFKSAWKQLKGSKRAIWSIAILMFLIALTVVFTANLFSFSDPITHYLLSYIALPLILYCFIGPFYGGGLMVAIQRFRHKRIDIKTGYRYLKHPMTTASTMVIIGLLSNLTAILINIPSLARALGPKLPYFDLLNAIVSLIVLTFCILSVPLVIDKHCSIRNAFTVSFRKMKPIWCRVFFIFFLAYFILFLIYLPIVIGLILHNTLMILLGLIVFTGLLIWFFPFLFLIVGHLYHELVDKTP